MTGKVFHNYLEIKMALGNEDPGQVSDVAKSMAASFETERPELKQLATELSEASEIQEQRRIFAEFTSKAGDMFEEALSGLFTGNFARWLLIMKAPTGTPM